jgi:hypothetical protein
MLQHPVYTLQRSPSKRGSLSWALLSFCLLFLTLSGCGNDRAFYCDERSLRGAGAIPGDLGLDDGRPEQHRTILQQFASDMVE